MRKGFLHRKLYAALLYCIKFSRKLSRIFRKFKKKFESKGMKHYKSALEPLQQYKLLVDKGFSTAAEKRLGNVTGKCQN